MNDINLLYSFIYLILGKEYYTFVLEIFTCPYDGLYVFNFVVSTTGVHQIVAKLVVDGVNQLDGISDTFHAPQEAQGGNSMVLSLKQGQLVWVADNRYNNQYLDSTNSSRFSSFSGFMLR